MRDHHEQTEFLKRCLRYDQSAGFQALEQQITQIQHDQLCVRRAVRLMTILIALALAGLVYAAIFLEHFPSSAQFTVNVICALGVGSLVSLLVFVGLGLVYRSRLNHRREECRRMVTGLLDARLNAPAAATSQEHPSGAGASAPAQQARGNAGEPTASRSTAPG